MEPLAKALVITGLGIAALGGLFWLASAVLGLRIGRLPGDVYIQRDGVTIAIPFATMAAISLLATGLIWLIGAWRR